MSEKYTIEKMRVNVAKLEQLRNSRGWSESMLARKLDLDYSYLYRILRTQRNVGAKFMIGLLKLCKHEGLDIYEFLNIQ